MKSLESLESILGGLSSDKARVTLLEEVHRPGDFFISKLILSYNPYKVSTFEKDVEHARENTPEMFEGLARELIDAYIAAKETEVADKVLKWNNKAVAKYAVNKLLAKYENKGTCTNTYYLKQAADLAKTFDKEKEREILEKILKKDDDCYSVEAYIQLGEYDKAIDHCLKINPVKKSLMRFGDLTIDYPLYKYEKALKIAKKHATHRVTEIAELVYKNFIPRFLEKEELYMECANIIGKSESAKKKLEKFVNKTKANNGPYYYKGLVSVLMSEGLEESAVKLMDKVSKYVILKEHLEILADLYSMVGRKEEESKARSKYLDIIISREKDNSYILSAIDKAIEKSGDKSLLEKKLPILEREKKYDEAYKISVELGKTELASVYNEINEINRGLSAVE